MAFEQLMETAAPDNASCTPNSSAAGPQWDPGRIVADLLEAAKLLPAQGPITAFVFLNSLQALEDLPFEEGLLKGGELFGCETYLSEDRYREKMAKGRIRPEDLADSLQRDLADGASKPVGPKGTRADLRAAMLLHPMRQAPLVELQWFIAETDALAHYRVEVPPESSERCIEQTRQWAMRELRTQGPASRDLSELSELVQQPAADRWNTAEWTEFSLRALWEVCLGGVEHLTAPQPTTTMVRHRDLLLEVAGEDCDQLTHEMLIPFCAAFLDQGFATWELPNRDAGLWQAFLSMYAAAPPVEVWLAELHKMLAPLAAKPAAQVIIESLESLGVSPAESRDFLTRELLALRGWAGMLWQAEDRGVETIH